MYVSCTLKGVRNCKLQERGRREEEGEGRQETWQVADIFVKVAARTILIKGGGKVEGSHPSWSPFAS